MSRRQALRDANAALDVRRLQEQAALSALQQRQASAAEARAALDQLNDEHRQSEAAWAAAAARLVLDVDHLRLWQAYTGFAQMRMEAGREVLAEQDEAVAAQRSVWVRHLGLTEAVEGVAVSAARALQRADEERRLLATEDAYLSRRLAS